MRSASPVRVLHDLPPPVAVPDEEAEPAEQGVSDAIAAPGPSGVT
jgi:hypothetical protein